MIILSHIFSNKDKQICILVEPLVMQIKIYQGYNVFLLEF